MPLLSRANFEGMYAGLADEPEDPSLYHYACNLILQPDGTFIQRPPLIPFPSAVTGNIVTFGSLRLRTGIIVDWVLTDTPTLYTISINVSGVVTITSAVSSANFTTATISLSSNTYLPWTYYSDATKDYIVFAGTPPWAWDGTTGATSLTELTNAPNSAARPTTHAGKLFFIKSSDARTIAWSEEYAINTGYNAGGYSNSWTLAQTSAEPLVSILGTNEGLYIGRRSSIGLIRGAVSTDFVTSATQDGVRTSGGTASDLVIGGNDIWWVDEFSQPWVCPIGGQPSAIDLGTPAPDDPQAIDTARQIEPYGYGDISSAVLTNTFAWSPPVYLPWQFGLLGPTVWFGLGLVNSTKPGALIVNARTRRPIGWVRWAHDTAANASPVIGKFEGAQGSTGQRAVIMVNDAARTRLYYHGMGTVGGVFTSVFSGGDQNSAGTAQATTYRYISGPIKLPNTGLRIGDIQLELFGKGTISGTVAVITSRVNDTSLITPVSWSATFSSSYREVKTVQVGWEDEARWGRIMVVVSSSTLSDFGIRRVMFEGKPVDLSDAA